MFLEVSLVLWFDFWDSDFKLGRVLERVLVSYVGCFECCVVLGNVKEILVRLKVF